MGQQAYTNAGDADVIDLSKCRNGVARLTTSDAGNGAAVFVIEVQGVSGKWVAIQLWNQKTSTWVDNLTGLSQTGFADVSSAKRIRARRTDASGTATVAALEFRED